MSPLRGVKRAGRDTAVVAKVRLPAFLYPYQTATEERYSLYFSITAVSLPTLQAKLRRHGGHQKPKPIIICLEEVNH